MSKQKRRASLSLQAEPQKVIEPATKPDVIDVRAAVAAQIRRELSGRKFSDSTILLREDRRR